RRNFHDRHRRGNHPGALGRSQTGRQWPTGPGDARAAESVLWSVRRQHGGWLGLAHANQRRRNRNRQGGRVMSTNPRTLLDKLWDAHQVVAETEATPGVMYVDLHLVHEVTSP